MRWIILLLIVTIGMMLSSCFMNRNRMLIEAVNDHDTELVASLLDQGANVNAKDYKYFEMTALMCAVRNGDKAMTELLLKSGADIDLKSNFKMTALQTASFAGYHEIVEVLLENSADPNTKSNGDVTVLIWAASEGHYESVRVLLDHGARINDQDDTGKTALMYASGACGCENVEGHYETVIILLEYGADVNLRDEQNFTALMYAETNDRQEIVRLLKDAGATE